MAECIERNVVIEWIDQSIKDYSREKEKEGASLADKVSLGARIAMLEETKTFITSLPKQGKWSEEDERTLQCLIADQTVNLEVVKDAYCDVCGHFHHTTPHYICRLDCRYYTDFINKLNQTQV